MPVMPDKFRYLLARAAGIFHINQRLAGKNKTPEHIDLGSKGERLAESYLQDKGYSTLARNLRIAKGEIDLVMESPADKALVFVEVKTRKSGHPEYAVNYSKRKQLLRLVTFACKRKREWQNRKMRIDVVTIVWPEESEPVLRHHPNAITLDDYR